MFYKELKSTTAHLKIALEIHREYGIFETHDFTGMIRIYSRHSPALQSNLHPASVKLYLFPLPPWDCV